MSLLAEDARLTWVPKAPQPRPAVRRPAVQDHDLPVLAAEESPRAAPDWESLLAEGTPPALALGAERRWQGKR